MTGRCHSVLSHWGSIRSLLYTLVVSGLLLHPLSLPAADANLKSLFNFQTKMASRGNTDAMIKLGEMCEEGLGTAKSEQQAREWYQKARDNGNPEGQSHLDQLEEKREHAAREQAAREQAAREQAAREQAAREQAAREQAEREQAAREQAEREQAAREQAAREQAARELARQSEEATTTAAAKKEMTAEEKAHVREEAIRRAEEVYRQSLEKQLAKEKAESDALKRSRSASSN